MDPITPKTVIGLLVGGFFFAWTALCTILGIGADAPWPLFLWAAPFMAWGAYAIFVENY